MTTKNTVLRKIVIDFVQKSIQSVLSNPTGESLPLGKAFRRLIQILSAGIFLPGSVGLTDPCAPGPYRIHTTLTLEEQDGICMTAQVKLTSKSLQIQHPADSAEDSILKYHFRH